MFNINDQTSVNENPKYFMKKTNYSKCSKKDVTVLHTVKKVKGGYTPAY